MVDIRELSETDQQRAFWLFFDAIENASSPGDIFEYMRVWTRTDKQGLIPAAAFFYLAAWAWPAALDLCADHGVSKSEINNEVVARVKQVMADYLREDVTPEEAVR